MKKLKFKELEIEFDSDVDFNYEMKSIIERHKRLSDLEEIYRISRSMLKHGINGDETREELLEKFYNCLEEIKKLSYTYDD